MGAVHIAEAGGPAGPILGRLSRAYAQTTEGQRWTAALALVLTVVFVGFGLRSSAPSNSLSLSEDSLPSNSLPASASSSSAPVASSSSPALASGSIPAAGVTVVPSASADLGSSTPAAPTAAATGSSDGGTPAPGAGISAPVAAPPPPALVALVRSGTGSDAGVAGVFLPDVGVPVKVLGLDPSRADMCSATAAVAPVVVAGAGLPASLRDCLTGSGETVLSHDEAGTAGRSVSTRLGATPAIVEAALAGPRAGLGIAAASSVGPEAQAAAAILRARGWKVTLATVAAGDTAGMSNAILGFEGAGVGVEVLAMAVADESNWVTLENVVAFHPARVVADVEDAIVNESYGPLADGTRAVAAQRVPWFARTHGPSPAQAGCLGEYRRATGSVPTDAPTLASVFMWCGEAHLLHAAFASHRGFPGALTSLTYDSPLTSALGPGEGGFGPREVADLIWHSSCSCWDEGTAFHPRVRDFS